MIPYSSSIHATLCEQDRVSTFPRNQKVQSVSSNTGEVILQRYANSSVLLKQHQITSSFRKSNQILWWTESFQNKAMLWIYLCVCVQGGRLSLGHLSLLGQNTLLKTNAISTCKQMQPHNSRIQSLICFTFKELRKTPPFLFHLQVEHSHISHSFLYNF